MSGEVFKEAYKRTATPNPFGVHWHHTSMRIKDPSITLSFYEDNFGFKLLDRIEEKDSTRYFLGHKNPDDQAKAKSAFGEPGSKESRQANTRTDLTLLELHHTHGDEKKADLKFNNGNVEPNRGWGHIAVNVDDVYKTCDRLQANKVAFKKLPNEGNMKGLAFALDPDGYWIEVVSRHNHKVPLEQNFSQTMFRVKDAAKSMSFYRDILGLTVMDEKHFPQWKFSLFFLQDPTLKTADTPVPALFNPVLELTHNHGTESDENFSYHNGNKDPVGYRNIGFSVKKFDELIKSLKEKGYMFVEEEKDGLAVVVDPDGYYVQLIRYGNDKL